MEKSDHTTCIFHKSKQELKLYLSYKKCPRSLNENVRDVSYVLNTKSGIYNYLVCKV